MFKESFIDTSTCILKLIREKISAWIYGQWTSRKGSDIEVICYCIMGNEGYILAWTTMGIKSHIIPAFAPLSPTSIYRELVTFVEVSYVIIMVSNITGVCWLTGAHIRAAITKASAPGPGALVGDHCHHLDGLLLDGHVWKTQDKHEETGLYSLEISSYTL